MPRSALLVRPLLVPVLAIPVLLLGACSGSGFWRYEENTLTLPGENPNMPAGAEENFQRARHAAMAEPAPLLTDAGDIWPGPSAAVPTLKDLQRQHTSELTGGDNAPALAPLPPLPSLPGYEISPQDAARAAPAQVFPGSIVPTQNGRVPIQGEQGYRAPAGTASGNIVVPNGNGTSTVISPTGQVTTIPTPK